MGGLSEVASSTVCRLSMGYFGGLRSEELIQIRHNLDTVLEDRGQQLGLFGSAPKLVEPDHHEPGSLGLSGRPERCDPDRAWDGPFAQSGS